MLLVLELKVKDNSPPPPLLPYLINSSQETVREATRLKIMAKY